MFRLWGKLFLDNRLQKDLVIENPREDMTRTKKVFAAVEDLCKEFDLAKPIWLDVTVEEFRRFDKARFHQDNFMEAIDFDFMEIQVIEED